MTTSGRNKGQAGTGEIKMPEQSTETLYLEPEEKKMFVSEKEMKGLGYGR